MRGWLRAIALVCLSAAASLAQTPVVTLSGVVMDPTGAVIPRATIELHGASGEHHATADGAGHFNVVLPPASYDVTVSANGFRNYAQQGLEVGARNPPLSIKLEIDATQEQVNVSSNNSLSTDSSSNKNALVFTEDKMDTFSDDPATMQAQLLALAGTDPSTPPQIFVDGFSDGALPPKETIREIRINQNPMSAQYDQFGQGRIEVFTKPGTNKFHGSVDEYLSGSAVNSRNPYLVGTQPAYSTSFLNGNLNGPLGKHMSFFLSANYYDLGNNAIIVGTTLNPAFAIVSLSQTAPDPKRTQTYSGRLDRQFGASDTFVARYIFSGSRQTNAGIGGNVAISEGYTTSTNTQTLQMTDTHLFGAKVVSDSSFQYIRTRLRQDPNIITPAIEVLGAVSEGGNPAQVLHDNQDQLEFREEMSISHGTHFIRTGARLRVQREANLSTSGYNGQFIFPSITAYQITEQGLANGQSDAAIRATCTTTSTGQVCGGATQFSVATGFPSASLLTSDIGIYAEDEWKAKPDFTFSYGVRFEHETAIPANHDLAPRLGFAWAIKPDKKTKTPFLTLRGGLGIFYQRFGLSNVLQTLRQNGVTEQNYTVTNPSSDVFNPNATAVSKGSIATLAATPPTLYQINPLLHSPASYQEMIGAERSLGKYGSLNVFYYQRRTLHMFESRNINAPLPGTYNPANPSSGVRPLGGTQNIYQYSSDGISNGRSLGLNANVNPTNKISFWAGFFMGHQESDSTGGPGGFASNSYNVGQDAGRISGYSPRQLYAGLNAKPGWDTQVNMFMSARSGTYFNITTGTDLNGDTQYNDRPAFATNPTANSLIYKTAYGTFDANPQPGEAIIPINYGSAPGLVYEEINFNKSFRFGPKTVPHTNAAGATPAGKGAAQMLGRYRLLFGASVDNPFNTVNRGLPTGGLTSPLFGQSTALNSSFSNSSGANRVISFRTLFSF